VSVLVVIVGLASGEPTPGLDGTYLKSYTPDGHGGRGDLVVTPHRHAAKRYTNAVDARNEWARVSSTHPRRPDGKPNRPLSAFTITIEDA
jgi:hypothetical protein